MDSKTLFAKISDGLKKPELAQVIQGIPFNDLFKLSKEDWKDDAFGGPLFGVLIYNYLHPGVLLLTIASSLDPAPVSPTESLKDSYIQTLMDTLKLTFLSSYIRSSLKKDQFFSELRSCKNDKMRANELIKEVKNYIKTTVISQKGYSFQNVLYSFGNVVIIEVMGPILISCFLDLKWSIYSQIAMILKRRV